MLSCSDNMTIKIKEFIEEVSDNFELLKTHTNIFEKLDSIHEDNISHKNYSVFEHTKKVYQNGMFFINFLSSKLGLDLAFTERTKEIFLLKCILHDIGKVDTEIYKDNQKIFIGHEFRGAKLAEEILSEFDLTSDEKQEIVEFVSTHTNIHMCLDSGKLEFESRLPTFSQNHFNIRDYLLFGLSDVYGSYLEVSNPEEYLYRIYSLISAFK